MAFQDSQDTEGLLLNTSSGIYFQFIRTADMFTENPERLSLQDVRVGENYAVIINNNADSIWNNVIRVKEIKDGEYSKGIFNYVGIPRPLYAELDKNGTGGNRVGHFEGGLTFKEKVDEWDPGKKVSFDIEMVPSTMRPTIFDQHVLRGKHFKFVGASYELMRINNNRTLLTLTSSYQLDTRINYYASVWGNFLLSDFQQRLLEVIKNRCENEKK